MTSRQWCCRADRWDGPDHPPHLSPLSARQALDTGKENVNWPLEEVEANPRSAQQQQLFAKWVNTLASGLPLELKLNYQLKGQLGETRPKLTH